MTTAFIFGATGKIGGALVRQLEPLAKSGQIELRLGVRSVARASQMLGQTAAHLVEFDLDTPDRAHKDAIAGTDTMFLLTGYTVDMLAQSKYAIDTAKRAGVGHIIHVGVHSEPDSINAHIGWHQFVEAYIERSGMSWTHLRPNWLMQNIRKYLRREGEELVLTTYLPENLRVSWIDAEDIGTAGAAIIRDPGAHAEAIYPLASVASNMGEVCQIVAETFRLTCRYHEMTKEEFRGHEGSDPYHRSSRHYYEQLREGGIPECDQIFDFQSLTGQPPRSWRQFMLANISPDKL